MKTKNLILLLAGLLPLGFPAQAQEIERPDPTAFINSCEQEQQTAPALRRTGWAEMPSQVQNEDYSFFTHDCLPSDSTLRNYTFCFDQTRYCSLWVAYPLHDCYIGQSDRTNRFGYDPDFDREAQADIGKNAYYPAAGSRSSHSRGHQLPSADRTASAADNLTTFYATNMTPQLQPLNGVKWAELEKDVRTWRCCDTLYVVTGAWFDPTRTPQYAYDAKGLGKACPVPSHYYKVLLRSRSGDTGKPLRDLPASELQCIGFWFDHENPDSWSVASSVRPVTEIEALTGFTFFVNVPQAPKSDADTALWPGIK